MVYWKHLLLMNKHLYPYNWKCLTRDSLLTAKDSNESLLIQFVQQFVTFQRLGHIPHTQIIV